MATNNESDLSQLSSSLRGLFSRKNWSLLWQTYTLGQKWPEIVGSSVAKKSEPAYIQKNTLWVYVQSSVLMQHMQPQKLIMLEKINTLIPDAGIQDIRWAMQPASPVSEQTAKATRTTRKPDPAEREAFEAMVSTVEDEQCRRALQKLWQTFNTLG